MENMEIIFDTDGVILDYQKAFMDYLQDRHNIPAVIKPAQGQYISLEDIFNIDRKTFNSYVKKLSMDTEVFHRLPVIDGAIDAINELKECYPDANMSVVTSVGDHPETVRMREQNLRDIGFTGKITCLPLNGCKKAALSAYEPNSIFIDDMYKNVKVAREVGHHAILFQSNIENDPMQANSWPEALEIIHRVTGRN